MALLQTEEGKGNRPMPQANGAELVAHRMVYSLAAALALNDIIEMGDIPADHVPVAIDVDCDELDTGADAIVLQAGILNSGKTDIDTSASGGGEWLGNSTVGQAGGLAREANQYIKRVAVDATQDRPFGLKVSTGPGTGATSGDVAVTLYYKAATHGV
jgi:hypothetical protein